MHRHSLQVKAENLVVKSGVTVITSETTKIAIDNELKDATLAGSKNTTKTFKIAIEFKDTLTADATYSVDFVINLNVTNN